MIHAVTQYFREHQSPGIRVLHSIVLTLVICQIILSNFMGFTKTGEISTDSLHFFGTWAHIITGLTLLLIFLVFAVLLLKKHGLAYFFPYLFGRFDQLKSDINQLKNMQLPEAEGGGLAAIVEGLGLTAVLFALLAGFAWFLSWESGSPSAHSIIEVHETLVGLVEAYLIGHGCMGLLHIYLFNRKLHMAH